MRVPLPSGVNTYLHTIVSAPFSVRENELPAALGDSDDGRVVPVRAAPGMVCGSEKHADRWPGVAVDPLACDDLRRELRRPSDVGNDVVQGQVLRAEPGADGGEQTKDLVGVGMWRQLALPS